MDPIIPRSNRVILPAPSSPDHSQLAQVDRKAIIPRNKDYSKKNLRAQITPVACTPCKTRKSKCDGARPTCKACSDKGVEGCVYDSAGDKRRTQALRDTITEMKEELKTQDRKIEDLTTELEHFKDIIRGVYDPAKRDRSIALAIQLASNGFLDVAQIAEAVRKPQMVVSSYPSNSHTEPTAGEAHSFPTETVFPYDPGLLENPTPYPQTNTSVWPTSMTGEIQDDDVRWSSQHRSMESVNNENWPNDPVDSAIYPSTPGALGFAPALPSCENPLKTPLSDSFNIHSNRAPSSTD